MQEPAIEEQEGHLQDTFFSVLTLGSTSEPELYAYLQEHHALTQRQLDALVSRQRRKPARPTLRKVDEALTERIEALERRVAALESKQGKPDQSMQ